MNIAHLDILFTILYSTDPQQSYISHFINGIHRQCYSGSQTIRHFPFSSTFVPFLQLKGFHTSSPNHTLCQFWKHTVIKWQFKLWQLHSLVHSLSCAITLIYLFYVPLTFISMEPFWQLNMVWLKHLWMLKWRPGQMC